jgi:hypothetical protein
MVRIASHGVAQRIDVRFRQAEAALEQAQDRRVVEECVVLVVHLQKHSAAPHPGIGQQRFEHLQRAGAALHRCRRSRVFAIQTRRDHLPDLRQPFVRGVVSSGQVGRQASPHGRVVLIFASTEIPLQC